MAYGPKNLQTSFAAASLTHFGGVYLLRQFLHQLRLRRFLGLHIQYPQRNNRYSITETLLALIYPIILGLEKIEVSAFLKTNGVFQYLTGLPNFPNPTTLRRFLVRSAPELLPQVHKIHNDLRSHFLCLPYTLSSFWLDCDSTVQTLYGNQEGALRGYNPDYPGKKSYHPLIVTEAHLKDCLGGFLRPGNVHTTEGIEELLKTIFSFLPHRNHLRLRADAGFYDGNFISLLRGNQVQFAIVARLISLFRLKIGGLRYHRVSPIFSTAEFHYQPQGWQKKERFVVLRRKLPEESAESQVTLFTLDRYAYSVIVTNLDLKPDNVFRFYQDRSSQERIVRTLKEDYPFAKAPTNSFAANAFYTELSLLAYNLVTWFKRLCLPDDWQSFTLPTIRHRLFMMPGEFVRSRNIPTLRFPRNNPYQDTFYYAQERIKKLTPLV
jgi:hypothetical protein